MTIAMAWLGAGWHLALICYGLFTFILDFLLVCQFGLDHKNTASKLLNDIFRVMQCTVTH